MQFVNLPISFFINLTKFQLTFKLKIMQFKRFFESFSEVSNIKSSSTIENGVTKINNQHHSTQLIYNHALD